MANTKEKKAKKGGKSNLIIGLVGGGLLLLLVGIIVLSEVIPVMTANSEFSSRLDGIGDAEIGMVEIVDPRGTQKQAIITSSKETAELRDQILRVSEGRNYADHVSSANGNWDLRLRFHAGEKEYDFYLTETDMYVVANNTQYHFTPGAGYSDFYSAVMAKLK